VRLCQWESEEADYFYASLQLSSGVSKHRQIFALIKVQGTVVCLQKIEKKHTAEAALRCRHQNLKQTIMLQLDQHFSGVRTSCSYWDEQRKFFWNREDIVVGNKYFHKSWQKNLKVKHEIETEERDEVFSYFLEEQQCFCSFDTEIQYLTTGYKKNLWNLAYKFDFYANLLIDIFHLWSISCMVSSKQI